MDNCITIGMDLGDKKHAIVGLDAKANIVLRRWLPNDQDSLRTFFERNKGAEVSWEEAEKIAQECVHRQCQELADYKRVRKVVVSKEPLARTSIQKVRRVAYKGALDE